MKKKEVIFFNIVLFHFYKQTCSTAFDTCCKQVLLKIKIVIFDFQIDGINIAILGLHELRSKLTIIPQVRI